METILSGNFTETNLFEMLASNPAFKKENLGFREQCREEAKKHPQNVRLDCDTIAQFNRFLDTQKNNISAAAVYSAINELDRLKGTDVYNQCHDSIDSKIKSPKCGSLSETFEEIKTQLSMENSSLKNQIIFT